MLERHAEPLVDIWSFHDDEACPTDRARCAISDGEWSRAQRFRAPSDRDAFSRGRATIRQILAIYLGQPPSGIQFAAGQYGKPSLAGDAGLRINWSHNDGRWLMAVALAGSVGVDIERVSPGFDWQGPASIAFHSDELGFIARQCEGRVERFYRLWVRKEAVFKAAGFGLHDDMARVTVVDSDSEFAATVTMLDGTRWHLHDVPAPAEPFVAAVAVGFPNARLRLRDLAELRTTMEATGRLPTVARVSSTNREARQ